MIQLGQKYYTFPLNLVCHTGKHLTNEFPIQNSLKHRNIKTPLFFNLAFEYFINVEEIKGDWNSTGHISIRYLLMMLIHWAKT
jgi:hypothetical protein